VLAESKGHANILKEAKRSNNGCLWPVLWAMKSEMALGQHEPANWLFNSESGGLRLWRPAGLAFLKPMRSSSFMVEGEEKHTTNAWSPL
jgi:hypothetical protein